MTSRFIACFIGSDPVNDDAFGNLRALGRSRMTTMLLARAVALFCLFALIACGGSPTPPAPTTVAVPVVREGPPVALPPPTFGEPQWQRGKGPPLTLTASDGSGLTL